jgi:hypothetical protein
MFACDHPDRLDLLGAPWISPAATVLAFDRAQALSWEDWPRYRKNLHP